MKVLVHDPYLFEYFLTIFLLLLLFGLSFLSDRLAVMRKWAGIGLIVAPVLYFFATLLAVVVNIPYTDDFNLLETIYNFRQADGFSEKIRLLFEQVNQHRFAFERSVMLLMVALTGTVNIKAQVLIGNLFMLGILGLLYDVFRQLRISWYYFIPVPYVVFNLVYYENALWGIAAIQNTPLIFFAMLSVWGLARSDRKGWYVGLAAALLTTFTSGSGMLAWIIGALILLFQKRYKLLVQWILIAAAIILFYFLFAYHIVPSNGEKPWKHPIFNLIFVFGFWGNALYLDIPHPLVPAFHADLTGCVLLGAAMGLLFVIWVARLFASQNRRPADWFLWGSMMFMMGTGAMFVISRPLSNYLMYGGNIFSRRYMIFGVVLLAVGYVALVVLLKNYRKIAIVVAAFSAAGVLLLHTTSYHLSLAQVRKFHEDLMIDSFYWNNFSTFLTTGDHFGDVPFWNHPTHMKNLIANLDATGLSHFPQTGYFPGHQQMIAQTIADAPFEGDFHLYKNVQNDLNNQPHPFLRFLTTNNAAKPAYLVLQSDQHTILLPAIPEANTWSDFLRTRAYYSNRTGYALFEQKLPAGQFKVYIMYPGPAASQPWKSVFTGKKVYLNGQAARSNP